DDAGIRAKLTELGRFPVKAAEVAAQHAAVEDARPALDDRGATASSEHWVSADASGRTPAEAAAYERGRGLLGEVLDRHLGRTDWDPHSPEAVHAVESWARRMLGLSIGETKDRPEAAEVRNFIEEHFAEAPPEGARPTQVLDHAALETRLAEMFGDGPRHIDALSHGDAGISGGGEHAAPDTVSFADTRPPEVRPRGDLAQHTEQAHLEWTKDGRNIQTLDIQRVSYEQHFERFPVEDYPRGADSPEARAATHEAALKLVDVLHQREVEALHQWFEGANVKDTYLARAGRTATAVMLADGTLHASTSLKEIAGEQASRRLPNDQPLRTDLPRTKNAADAALPPNHEAVRAAIDSIPADMQSQFRARCGEPSTLSSIARSIEPAYRDAWVRDAGARSFDELTSDQQAAYRQDFASELARKLNGGQIASHYATGIETGREQFPCATDDLLIDHFGLHSDYVDRISGLSHIDEAHGVISLVPPDDPLRGPSEMLASAHPDWLVVAMHGEHSGTNFAGVFGEERLSHVEVARLVKSIVDGHDGLQGRSKIVVLSCDAGVDHRALPTAVDPPSRAPTSFARELARRMGTDVLAPKDKVWVSDSGRVAIGENPPENVGRFEPGADDFGGSDWIQSDRSGEISQPSGVNNLIGRQEGGAAGTGPEHWEKAQSGPFGTSYGGEGGGTAVPESRPPHLPDVWHGEFREAAREVLPEDFGNGSVVRVEPEGNLVRVETADGQVHYFRPEVTHDLGDVARTEPHRGTAADPHVLRVNDRVAHEQLGRAWVHGITEGLQHEAAAAHRPEPQGLIRRAVSRIANLFGSQEPAPRTESHVDTLTDARLNERRYLMREFWSADSAEAQLRARTDLAGLDRELSRAGYPVHELEQPPEHAAPHGTTESTALGDGRDHSTHDEIWHDPPWEREGRRPSLDELIPSSDEEAARWEPQIREAFARELEGHEFAGMRVRLSVADDHPVSAFRNDVTVRLDIMHPERGMVGRIVRVFHRDYDGSLYVEHVSLRMSDDMQGSGFAREWNRYLEDWYRYSGVDHIEVHAASTVGGYAWARDGYDWAPGSEHRAENVFGRLRTEMRGLAGDAEAVERWRTGDSTVDIEALGQRYGVDTPERLLHEINRQYESGQEILDRAARHPFGSADYPTPLEVSRAGWNGEHGAGATWLGKRAMLGADWKGVKPVSEGGPRFPRSAHLDSKLAGGPRHDPPGGPPGAEPPHPTGEQPHQPAPSAQEIEQRILSELAPDIQSKILEAVGPATRAIADSVMAHLQDAAHRVDQALGGDQGHARLVGEDRRVKSPESLARKYVSDALEAEIKGTPLSVDTFLGQANDIVRFSLEIPEGAYTGGRVLSVLHELGGLGYRAEDGGPIDPQQAVKNFWQAGNRFYGLNVTLREPGGHLFELQFPTDRSWAAGKLTHDLYEQVRQEQLPAVQRVDAYLKILAINREYGLPEHVPVDQNGLPAPKNRGFADWIQPSVWDEYSAGIHAEGKTFASVIAEHGLTRDDFPRAETIGLFHEPGQVLLPRDLQHGGEGPPAAEPAVQRGDPRPTENGAVEQHETGVDVRPESGGDVPVRRGEAAEPPSDLQGGGGDNSPGGSTHHLAERGGAAPDVRGGRGGAGGEQLGRTEPGAHRVLGDTRGGLVERIRARLSSLFSHEQGPDPRQAERAQIERDSYQASVRDAQRRFRDAVEADPQVRQARDEVRAAHLDEQRGRADAATH
ncbi:MAG TPA: hypothetical protein VJT31_02385, partial [Rugosimonospora sp.]|nr:hypothetical protein [Rugosimonospora sp.]